MTSNDDAARAAEPGVTPVCAIGASAGGIEALQAFFSALPPDLGFAYVVVVHLAPDQPSHLDDILANRTPMPVRVVHGATRLAPDHVYVVAPGHDLAIDGDDLAAHRFSQPRGRRDPIDLLFRSVAAARGDGVVMVLSGAGTDGTIGARAVKEAGGIVFVQDPDDAAYPTMPRSVLATGIADIIAPAGELAERLRGIGHVGRAARTVAQAPAADEMPRIVGLLRMHTGHDFGGYKMATLLRRVARRMQVTHRATVAEYADYLDVDPDEARALVADLLISVTLFFRDSGAFRSLAERTIAPLVATTGDDEEVRVWVVGCASGEEAYSIAILLLEEMTRQRRMLAIQVFATDLDERALAAAREGRYPKAIEADVPEDLLRRYFTPEGQSYVVKAEVRELVLFATHNVLKDPPFVRLDLLACRNLLIYLDREVQRQLQSLFHYALKPKGFLFLGSAETIDRDELFEVVDREARLYCARAGAERTLPALPRLPAATNVGGREPPPQRPRDRSDHATTDAHLDALERAAPASVLVDDRYDILHLSPSAGRFFVPAGGPLTADVTAMVRAELQSELRRGLHRAFEQGEATVTPATTVAIDGVARRVVVHVAPAESGEDGAARALVFFIDGGPVEAGEPGDDATDAEASDLVRHLRAELEAAHTGLQNSRHDHYETVQELRAANEELHSINEEYRSTSEELETSKEELQSMNEELQTVNTELKTKLDLIAAANSDLQNLIQATDIGTLFLDTGLRIRLFTPRVAGLFNVTEADVGRAITDFTHRLVDHDIEREAAKVLRELTPAEREVATEDGHWLKVRIRPYRTVDDRIDGVVVTFLDVTEQRAATARLRASEAKYRSLFESMGEGLLVIEIIRDVAGEAVDVRYVDANPAALRLADLDFFDKRLSDLSPDFHPDWWRIPARVAETGTSERHELYAAPVGKWYAIFVWKPEPEADRVALIFVDVTERRAAQEALRQTRDLLTLAAEASGLGWATCDFATGRAQWDERARAMIGLEADETTLEDWLARVHRDDRRRVKDVFDHCAATGETFDLTYRVVHDDGSIRRVQATGVFPPDADGRTGRASALLRDLTERDDAERG